MAGRVDGWPFGWVILIFDLFEELSWKLSWVLLSSVLFEKMTQESMCYAAGGPSTTDGELYNFDLYIKRDEKYVVSIWRFDVCHQSVYIIWRCRLQNLQSPFYYWDLRRFGLEDCPFYSRTRGQIEEASTQKILRVDEGKDWWKCTSRAAAPAQLIDDLASNLD